MAWVKDSVYQDEQMASGSLGGMQRSQIITLRTHQFPIFEFKVCMISSNNIAFTTDLGHLLEIQNTLKQM